MEAFFWNSKLIFSVVTRKTWSYRSKNFRTFWYRTWCKIIPTVVHLKCRPTLCSIFVCYVLMIGPLLYWLGIFYYLFYVLYLLIFYLLFYFLVLSQGGAIFRDTFGNIVNISFIILPKKFDSNARKTYTFHTTKVGGHFL